jgi:NAD(P)-dependent dehydrogenase (short-subunit alcohol dehydrogenase family)
LKLDQSSQKIAIVTGANRGIGLETCRQLSRQGIRTILTSRDEAQGQSAQQNLVKEGFKVLFHQLDVTDLDSIFRLRAFVEEKFDRLDILVNNAGVFLDRGISVVDLPLEILNETMDTNFIGALKMSQAFVPLMRKNKYGRIINVSSGMGSISSMGGGSAAYKLSKAALNALTRIMADEIRNDNILVNTMSPGWVRTDMGGASAPRSLAQGADTVIWLATLPDGGPTGGFFEDRKSIPW